ncbi:hypothetical protein FKM82_000201 [Ascaphus truei]
MLHNWAQFKYKIFRTDIHFTQFDNTIRQFIILHLSENASQPHHLKLDVKTPNCKSRNMIQYLEIVYSKTSSQLYVYDVKKT